MVHCHLIIGEAGCVLVDTGTPGSEDKIERALAKHGRYYERRKEMTYCVAHWWGPLFLRSGVPGEPAAALAVPIIPVLRAAVRCGEMRRLGQD
ncbi:hypothetical protein [Paraburkholderia sp. BL6665CI2N2]|uniref:hypothetical protein n=1 Tax=Paraburkholderia sp. BL6665CI2N2 TaxID=1938806 RepID=UPI001FB92EAA|nr:hypothetical protein [Paraburkholderia sp. BL6665CI2N2]